MKELTIALAGNPNVGKSVIFNQLTGEHQHVGNWPGKTVEKFEGTLNFLGKKIKVIDLPGACSLSAFSQEEEITKDFIKKENPDVVINIVDASTLEQNLFLTLQLLELGANVVIALNMVDVAKEKGIVIDSEKLSNLLGVPVVPTIATQGKGIEKLVIESINAMNRKKVKKRTFPKNMAERYRYIHRIVSNCQKKLKVEKTITEKLDDILLHKMYGYVFLGIILCLMFFFIFKLGDISSGFIGEVIERLKESIPAEIFSNPFFVFFYKMIAEGIIAGLTIAIPYLIPFYIFLAILEDSGYLPRIAFLMDGLMHKIGLHGKAFIPMFLGYGCSVPACLGCRIMESEEQQFLTAFLATMIPCAARSVIILGVIGAYLGFGWVVGIYLLNLFVVFALGSFFSRIVIKRHIGLIMGMPSYKMPSISSIVRRAWMNVKNYIIIAFPIIIFSTFIINTLDFFGMLEGVSNAISPVTSGLLGLPPIVGVTLIVGFLRKELAIILLVALLGTTDLSGALTPLQMVVFTIVSIFYIPCAATIATLAKEFGWRNALFVTVFEIIFAIFLGAVAFRVLPLLGLL